MEIFDFLKNNGALIITPVNRYYFTGFSSSLGYLFLVKNQKILYVDGRYIESAKSKIINGTKVRLLTKLSTAITEIIKEYGISSFLCEDDITVRQAESLKKISNGKIAPSTELSSFIESIRSVKTEQEKGQIIKAQRIAEKAYLNTLNIIKPGVTEKEIALKIEYDMQIFGADGISFETIAISGKNTSLPHGVPTDKPIENGDFVTLDFGAVYHGYCSDTTRTVAVGFADQKMQEVYNTVLGANIKGIEAIKAGVKASQVDFAAREFIKQKGFGEYFTHSTGHGVGLYIHEGPNITLNNNEILQQGNVITCEPGIYLEGNFGVRIEDMLFVTDFGSENLTNLQKNLLILK